MRPQQSKEHINNNNTRNGLLDIYIAVYLVRVFQNFSTVMRNVEGKHKGIQLSSYKVMNNINKLKRTTMQHMYLTMYFESGLELVFPPARNQRETEQDL